VAGRVGDVDLLLLIFLAEFGAVGVASGNGSTSGLSPSNKRLRGLKCWLGTSDVVALVAAEGEVM